MRLENILALTHGRVVNEPFVKIFENIVFDSKVVKRGDLFIAFDEDEIEDAIFNGAYGVMFDKPTQITDNEIAWIKVKSCEDSLKKVLRFILVEKNITVYSVDEIILKLSQQTMTDQNFVAINGELKSIYKQLLNLQNDSIILFSPTLSDESIFTNVNEIPAPSESIITLKEHTLFESSFIYDGKFYERQQLAPIFIPYLEQLLNLYKKVGISFKLRRFNPISNFEVTFINKNFEIKDFGSTDKALIFEKNMSLVSSEIDYLTKKASWAKVIYILPTSIKNIDGDYIYNYNNKNEILDILKNNSFNFAFIADADKSILDNCDRKPSQLTLSF